MLDGAHADARAIAKVRRVLGADHIAPACENKGARRRLIRAQETDACVRFSWVHCHAHRLPGMYSFSAHAKLGGECSLPGRVIFHHACHVTSLLSRAGAVDSSMAGPL